LDAAFEIELKQGFLEEAQDLLSRVESLSLQLEKDPSNREIYAEFARLAHNFKGSGKAVGFDHISKMSHRLEDYILAIQQGKVMASPENLDFLFRCLDRLKADVAALMNDLNAPLDHHAIIGELDRRLQHPVAENVKVAEPVQASTSDHHASPPLPTSAAARESQPVFRVPKPKLDALLEMVGEQMILQSFLDQCKQDIHGNHDLLVKTINQLGKLMHEIQNQTLSLTLVQMVPLFTKLERAVRDAARMCDKPVEIHLVGTETEIDKTLVDGLSDALTHIVRNAVDHGLETREGRIAAGKNETGQVHIEARRSGGQLWIEIRDDGKGMDPSVLRNKALQKGLITEEEADRMQIQDAYRLIFKNGFSTKEAVSEISGRGVGMNVVEEVIREMKGTIEIESEIGRGTRFQLKLPLSLAIFNGAVVRIRDSRFVIPSSEISEITRISLVNRLPLDQHVSGIRIRDELFELVDLRETLFGGQPVTESSDHEYPVLLTRDGRCRAFLVDEIVSIQKIVQKPIGDEVKLRTEYAAGTILGDGVPGIILSLRSVQVAA
jgi:two-component system chemotaxis sensor kinase CheA